MVILTCSPQKGVNGFPISSAQNLQRSFRGRRILLARRINLTPKRVLKSAVAARIAQNGLGVRVHELRVGYCKFEPKVQDESISKEPGRAEKCDTEHTDL